MAEAVDAGRDFSAVTTDREDVTVRRADRRTGATVTDVTGVHALRALPDREYPGGPQGGEMPAEALSWQVRADHVTLTGGLRKGDQLIDAGGTVWVVQSATLPRGSGVYTARTTRLPGT